jgi:hypothetical protein
MTGYSPTSEQVNEEPAWETEIIDELIDMVLRHGETSGEAVRIKFERPREYAENRERKLATREETAHSHQSSPESRKAALPCWYLKMERGHVSVLPRTEPVSKYSPGHLTMTQ